MTRGSRTVEAQRTEVALRDISYFAASTGNEAATNSCGQGLLTGVIRGKAYFFSWSIDVKVEGKNVCRHQDLMGHNQASFPSNTPLFPFIERGIFKGNPCKKEEKRIERACEKEKEDDDKKKFKFPRKKFFKLGPLKLDKNKSRNGSGDWHWTDDHCDGMSLPVGALDAEEYLGQFREAAGQLTKLDTYLEGVKQWAMDYIKKVGWKTAGKVVAKAGAKQLGGSSVPLAGNILMGVWTVVDAVGSISDVAELKTLYSDLMDDIDTLRQKVGELRGLVDRYSNEGATETLLFDAMDALATVNPCTRARKCNLVPYSTKGGVASKVEPASKGGCCPSQTGHHLIPEVMVRGACPGYNHGGAPTVCVEGRSQHMGSHKRVHSFMNMFTGLQAKDAKISLDKAIDAAAASHAVAFPFSKCSGKCIKAQLEAYYKQTCPDAQLNAMTPDGKMQKTDVVGDGGVR